MSRLRKLLTALAGLVAIFVTVYFLGIYASFNFLRDNGHASFGRWMSGEPGATQDVNDAADWLLTTGAGRELEKFAAVATREFESRASELPKSRIGKHPLVPTDRLPEKFWKLGGTFTAAPEVILRRNKIASMDVVVRWGNGRHQIVIFAAPPAAAPTGFAVRKVTDRVYVIANES